MKKPLPRFLLGILCGMLFLLVYERGMQANSLAEAWQRLLHLANPWTSTVPIAAKQEGKQATIYLDDRRPAANSLSLEARLLYSTLIGRPYGLALSDLKFQNLPANLSATGFSLASAARQALLVEDGQLAASQKRLLDFLASASKPSPLPELPADVAPMRSDDLAMLHVYALVMSGQTDATVATLEKFIDSKHHFTRAFCIMALRAIGTAKARELIKSRTQGDESFMAQEALAIEVPNFIEPKMFAFEVPPNLRFREHLLQQAKRNDTLAILPTMLLSFVGPDAPAEQMDAELSFLRGLHQSSNNALWRKYMYGYRALAFRSQEPYAQWLAMYKAERDPLHRSFLLRAIANQHPERFVSEMPAQFSQETGSWTQLEFIAAYKALVKGQTLYSPYDAIWMPPASYRQAFPYVAESAKTRSAMPLLKLWAEGKMPPAKNCPACPPRWIRDFVEEEQEPLFVQGFLHLRELEEDSYVTLLELNDARLLPVVEFLAKREAPSKIKQANQKILFALREKLAAPLQCCEEGEKCLRAAIAHSVNPQFVIKNQAQALQYLQALNEKRDYKIDYLDADKRSARVTRSSLAGDHEIYQYQDACWRKF